MEVGIAPFASVPAVQKSAISSSPYYLARCAWSPEGQGRELHFHLCRLKAKPAWHKLHILGSSNSTLISSGALFSVRKSFYGVYVLKCSMQRHHLFEDEINVFQKGYRSASNPPFSGEFRKSRSRRARLSGGIAEIGNTIMINWRPALEEILFVSSIALAYIAGIATTKKPACKSFLDQFQRKEGSQDKESMLSHVEDKSIKDNDQPRNSSFSASKMWDELQQKIETAALKVECDDIRDFPEKVTALDLSLQAICQAPRLRLLLSTVQLLRKEAERFMERKVSTEQGYVSKEVLDCLCSSIGPVLQSWLSHEHFLMKAEYQVPQEEAFAGIAVSFDQNYIINHLERTGKAQLYVDFFYFIFFGSIRSGSSCGCKTVLKYADGILEDIVVTVAEGAAEQYLNLVSNYATGFDGNEWPAILLPSILSTRTLESFRNQLALRSWFHQNFESVAAMYEDRVELWTLRAKYVAESGISPKIRRKRLRVLDQDAERDGAQIVVARYSIPVNRSKELKSLSGCDRNFWFCKSRLRLLVLSLQSRRYYYSLYLEFFDIAGPVLKIVLSKLGEGVSFLLVCLIGRSLGLIYEGIRQSIQWGSK
ncbi:hypothetical protein O6H91_14G008700 [Diphasiastrum complanatum]|uniref:Uncharacterized protein n=1 Tax=Diphasiastrum complanatum TaxID=34168 RepID=A0ACC2BM38_DIPCM|nr:hypothetical protein O6H91_14G008700 [Diphasiastrum complanatum]